MTKRGRRPHPGHRLLRALSGLVAGLVVALCLPSPSAGQAWFVDAYTGRTLFDTAPATTASTNAALGLRYGKDRRTGQIAAALPLGSDGLQWAMVSLGDRLATRRGRAVLGLDVSGQGNVFRDSGLGLSGGELRASLLPMASTSLGPLIVEGRTGGAWYRGRWDDLSWSRTFHVSELELAGHPHADFRLAGEVRHLRGEGEDHTFLGVSALARLGSLQVFASAGDWMDDAIPSSHSWAVGASFPVHDGVQVWATARRDSFDPLFLTTAPRSSWATGVSIRVGGARSRPPPAGAEIRPRGTVVVRLPLSEASSPPAIAGDFSGWEPVHMHRRGGEWRIELSLAPGVYQYAFRSADGEWFVPEGVPGRRDDGMGGWVAVLVVPRDP